MKPYKLTLLIIVVLMLQVGFLPAWQPLGVVPDLLLAVVICLALYTTATEALICAMVVGLALDISSGADFGLRLGFYTVVALGVSLLHRAGLALDSLPWRLGLAAILVLLANGVILIGLALHGANLPGAIVASRLIVSVVLELILIMIVGPIVRRLASGGEGLLSMASRGKH
jgi:rod shape-determining protein MreD